MRRAKESIKSPQSKKIPKTSQIQQSESLEKLLSRYKAILTLHKTTTAFKFIVPFLELTFFYWHAQGKRIGEISPI